MDGVEAIDLIASWRRILIEGKANQITSMLKDLEERLKSKGFERCGSGKENELASSTRETGYFASSAAPRAARAFCSA